MSFIRKYRAIPAVLAMIWLYGCAPVKSLLNRFPGATYGEEQNKSLQDNQSNLSQIGSPDLVVNISNRDFVRIMDSAMSQMSKQNFRKEHVISCRLNNFSVSTDAQLINFSTHISLALDTLGASLEGSFSGYVSFAMRNDSLMLFPELRNFHVDKLTFKKLSKFEDKAVAIFFNKTIKVFIRNINGYLISKTSGINLNMFGSTTRNADMDDKNYTTVELSQPVRLSLPPLSTACLIDASGIHIMGAMQTISGTTVTDNPGDFNSNFSVFQNSFNTKLNAAFQGLPSNGFTYAVINKAAFAQVLNNSLNNETIRVNYEIDTSLSINKELSIQTSDIDCDKVNQVNCPGIKDCADIQEPPNMNSIEKYAWDHTGRQAKIDLCNQANKIVQDLCDKARQQLTATCNDFKNKYNSSGGKIDLGSISVKASVNANAMITITSMLFSNDLSAIHFTLRSDINAPSNLAFSFKPARVDHILCKVDSTHQISFTPAATAFSPITLGLTVGKSEDKSILMTIHITPVSVPATITPIPITFIDKTLPSLLDCPFFSDIASAGDALLHVTKNFHDIFNSNDFSNKMEQLIFEGKYTVTTKDYSIILPVKGYPITLLNNKIVLSPLITDKYIGFSD